MTEKDHVDRLIEAVRRREPLREDDTPYLSAAIIFLESRIALAQLILDVIDDAYTKAIRAHYGLPPSRPGVVQGKKGKGR